MNFHFAAASIPLDGANDDEQPLKVSTAEITLKSATLPRRKLDGPKFGDRVLRASNDTRSAPIRENQYQSPFNSSFSSTRSTSLEPQQQQQQQHKPREHYIPIQRPGGGYISNTSSQRSVGATLSRQSTNDSDTSDTQTSTTTMGQSSATANSSQPIKKSPREFIIPIAVEGGGIVTPRASSLEPSESNNSTSTSTSFSRFGTRPRKISSIFNDRDSEDDSPFNRMNLNTSIGRDGDADDKNSPFTYRLRSTRPLKKTQSGEGNNDSGSSGEEDDEDGFEILTAENLFSTLLSRVCIIFQSKKKKNK